MDREQDARRASGRYDRRAFVARLGTLGVLTACPGLVLADVAPEVAGTVWVNGAPARATAPIRAGDTVRTGTDGELVFAIGDDVFKVRANSEVTFTSAVESAYEVAVGLVRGAMMAVFGKGAKRITTPLAALDIRGTGVYIETYQRYDYLCTCYGDTLLATGTGSQAVHGAHHAPRMVLRGTDGRPRVVNAPMMNHSDDELVALEQRVGRTPHFDAPA